jgi:protease-4
MANKRFWLFALFGYIWRGLDGVRKTVHLLLMLFLLAVMAAAVFQAPMLIPKSTALVIAPDGALVDQLDGDAASRAWGQLLGATTNQTLTRDLIEAIDRAADDNRINALVLQLGSMGGAGLATLRDVAAAIDRFAESGKPVVAVGDSYSQGQYYLAAHADQIWMHPEGVVFLEGFGAYRTFYREALEKLMVDVNVFKVGEYKSFVEPWIRDDMSPEARENNREWLNGLWEIYQADVTTALDTESGLLERYTSRLPEFLEETGGDFGELALSTQLVDALVTRTEADERLIEITGRDPRDNGWRGIHHRDYLASVRVESPFGQRPRKVGVVVAAGDIVDGRRPPGMIGGDSTAALLREAIYDDEVEAVVLRVTSGGGSAFASEIIAEQVQALRAAGKPVVVSMGDVAASGGYWISMDADEILASPATITGSIGIGALFPTFQRGLDWLGVHVDGVGTTEWAGQLRADRELSERTRQVLQTSIEHGYQNFITRVADARGMPVDDVDEVARGRVWLGRRAVDLDLIDGLGGLSDAIDSAARRAGIESDYSVKYIEREPGFREALVMQLTGSAARLAINVGVTPDSIAAISGAGRLPARAAPGLPGPASQMGALAGRLGDVLERLGAWNDPRGMYLHCFCDVVP